MPDDLWKGTTYSGPHKERPLPDPGHSALDVNQMINTGGDFRDTENNEKHSLSYETMIKNIFDYKDFEQKKSEKSQERFDRIRKTQSDD